MQHITVVPYQSRWEALYQQACSNLADKYAALKKQLTEKYPLDIDGYCDNKDAFVKELEQKALQWKNLNF